MPHYRADHVGSLLRPPELLEARAKHADERMSAAELREVEEASIFKALEMQRAAGLDVVSDGEYRRAGWSSPAPAGSIEGLTQIIGTPIRRSPAR